MEIRFGRPASIVPPRPAHNDVYRPTGCHAWKFVFRLFFESLLLLMPLPRFILGFFYFQYVVRRYRTNQTTVQTVGMLVEKLDGVFKHRYAPGFLQSIYARLKGLVGKAAEYLVR